MHTRPVSSLRWFFPVALLPLVVALACKGQKTEPDNPSEPGTDNPDTPIGDPELWENRWTESLTAHIGVGTPAEAFDECVGLIEKSKGAWKGTPTFTMELAASGNETNDYRVRELGKGDTDWTSLKKQDLARFCRIEPATGNARELATAEWVMLGDWLRSREANAAPDLPNVVPLGITENIQTTSTLVGATSAVLADKTDVRIHVVVADTEPSGEFTEATSANTEHGGATARLIYSLLCGTAPASENGSPGCGIKVSTQHALPYSIDESSRTSRMQSGEGQYGTHFSLAQAIDRTTRAHLVDKMPTVLNLSLGWNAGLSVPVRFGAYRDDTKEAYADRLAAMRYPYEQPNAKAVSWKRPETEVTGSERAVYEALVRARCAGIIPIASAGNRTNHPDDAPALRNGPLLPAGWMVHTTADTTAYCEAHGYENRGWQDGSPLVYAVSGVDRQARPVGLGRPGGNAPLAALALGVTVADANQRSEPFHSISGTSASAGVASAAVAAAWYEKPTASGDKIMQAVYSSGSAAMAVNGGGTVTADFGEINGKTDTQIVQICAAAKVVNPAISCPAARTTLGSTGGATGTVSAAASTPIDCATAPTTAPCGARYEPTPESLLHVWPQPPTHGCPPCDLEIVSQPGKPLAASLTIRTAEATPFWQTTDFTNFNTVDGYYIELKPLVGQSQILKYTTPSELGQFAAPNSEVEFALTGPLNVFSATLVLEGHHNITRNGKSWNIPLPITKP